MLALSSDVGGRDKCLLSVEDQTRSTHGQTDANDPKRTSRRRAILPKLVLDVTFLDGIGVVA
jgi:hypothetical protein